MFPHTGFSTAAFDLSGNIAGDSRAGLDERTLTEVRRIMERESCDFDEARVLHMNRMFRKNGTWSRLRHPLASAADPLHVSPLCLYQVSTPTVFQLVSEMTVCCEEQVLTDSLPQIRKPSPHLDEVLEACALRGRRCTVQAAAAAVQGAHT